MTEPTEITPDTTPVLPSAGGAYQRRPDGTLKRLQEPLETPSGIEPKPEPLEGEP